MPEKKTSHSMIDMNRLQVFFGNNSQTLYEFLNSYIEYANELSTKIKLAIQDKNQEKALFFFHKLRGSSSNSGFTKIEKLCKKAEEKLADSDWDAVIKLYQDIETILHQLQKEIIALQKT